MTPAKQVDIAAIRKRTDAQRNRYGFHWNQILRDRANLLKEVDRLTAELKEATRCKHPTKRGTGSVSTDGKIVTSELWCGTCGEKLS